MMEYSHSGAYEIDIFLKKTSSRRHCALSHTRADRLLCWDWSGVESLGGSATQTPR